MLSLVRFAPVVLALAALSCAPALPHATAADAERVQSRYPNTRLAELEQGRELYVGRCSGCHMLKAPDSMAPSAWPGAVAEMRTGRGVMISSSEERQIVAYLVAVSSR
jgi:mono/diheme cytochrome c family protein